MTELRELGGEVAAIELTADERADDLGPKECDGLGVVARRDGCIHGSSCAERRAEQTTSAQVRPQRTRQVGLVIASDVSRRPSPKLLAAGEHPLEIAARRCGGERLNGPTHQGRDLAPSEPVEGGPWGPQQSAAPGGLDPASQRPPAGGAQTPAGDRSLNPACAPLQHAEEE
ncbi:MAG: hypothetical protein IPG04_39495 [Polyangiaceae bacterium]|nr:hypothetical protein [Polyangiaceae bacterium]